MRNIINKLDIYNISKLLVVIFIFSINIGCQNKEAKKAEEEERKKLQNQLNDSDNSSNSDIDSQTGVNSDPQNTLFDNPEKLQKEGEKVQNYIGKKFKKETRELGEIAKDEKQIISKMENCGGDRTKLEALHKDEEFQKQVENFKNKKINTLSSFAKNLEQDANNVDSVKDDINKEFLKNSLLASAANLYLQVGQINEIDKKTSKSNSDYTKAAEIFENINQFQQASILYQRAGKQKKADLMIKKAAERSYELFKKEEDNDTKAEFAYDAITKYHQLKNDDLKVKIAKEAISDIEKNEENEGFFAFLYSVSGQPNKAKEIDKKIHNKLKEKIKTSRNPDDFKRLADISSRLKNYKDSISTLKKLTEILKADKPQGYNFRIMMLEAQIKQLEKLSTGTP